MMRLGQNKTFDLSTPELGVEVGKTLHFSALVYCQWQHYRNGLHTGNPDEAHLGSTRQFARDGWGHVHFVKQTLQEIEPANLAEHAENIGVCYDCSHGRSSCSLASISVGLLPSVSRMIPRAASTSFNSGTVRPAISAAFASETRCCRHSATAPSSFSVGWVFK